MKTTKYILRQTLGNDTQAFETEKVVRFQTGLRVCHMWVNEEGSIVLTFDERPQDIELSEYRNEVYVFAPAK